MRSAAHCSRALIVCLIAVTLPVSAVWAYSPPVDTAGPLLVRIEGPDKVEQADTPYPVRVVLVNRGSRIVEGDLRLRLIDRWYSDPSDAVPFGIEAGGSRTVEFQVTAGEGTFAAHYPIHALARFEWEGSTANRSSDLDLGIADCG